MIDGLFNYNDMNAIENGWSGFEGLNIFYMLRWIFRWKNEW